LKRFASIALICAGVTGTPAFAATLRVPSEYVTINAALDAANRDDVVLVAPGVYDQYEVRQLDDGNIATAVAFLVGDVALVSELGADWTTLRLDGSHIGPALCRTFGMSGIATIEGFTLTGSSPGLGAVQFPYSDTCVVRGCIMRDFGSGGSGGGVGIASTRSSVEVYSTRFENIDGTSGAAIRQTSSTLIVEDCEFRSIRSGAVSLTYDANFPHATGLTMRRCQFYDNEKTTGSGGAVSIASYTYGLIEDCWFENNRSVGPTRSAGAIRTAGTGAGSEFVIRNCTFVENYTVGVGEGGAIRADGASVTIEGNTFWKNSQELDVSHGGAAVVMEADANVFVGNVVSSSTGDQAVSLKTGTLATGCNVYWDNPLGHTSGFTLDPTDLIADPMFCDPEDGDFTVNVFSPCLPENNPLCGELIGAWGLGCGSVSVEPSSWGRIKNLYRHRGDDRQP
jgi:hypothetical protein